MGNLKDMGDLKGVDGICMSAGKDVRAVRGTPKELYADIIGLPHHSSHTHPRMSMRDRAAQFSPFAALSGYDEVVSETSRLTESQVEPDESLRADLDFRLRQLLSLDSPEITVSYFLRDTRKSGGEYVTHCGRLKKTDALRRKLVFADGFELSVDDVVELSSDELDFA